jgi:LysR family transcriptional regulator, low CO2-responsive transcriptional regulator
MDTRLLKVFCAVAESGSLVTASRKVHLTPSALSHALKALETELGCKLFERVGKRMLLNQAGEQLLTGVRPPLAALESAAEAVRLLGESGRIRMRIGAAASACQHILPGVIRELKKVHARIELQIESGDIPEMMEWIRTNRVDLALGVAPDDHGGFEARRVFRDELMFVFAPSHPWATGRPITREELRVQPLILYQRHSLTARLIERYFNQLDVNPRNVMEIASMAAIKELVRLNLGVSILAPWTASRELVRGPLRMRPIGSRPLRRTWAILWFAGRPLNAAEETFCRLCRTHAAGMRLDRRDVPPLKGR